LSSFGTAFTGAGAGLAGGAFAFLPPYAKSSLSYYS